MSKGKRARLFSQVRRLLEEAEDTGLSEDEIRQKIPEDLLFRLPDVLNSDLVRFANGKYYIQYLSVAEMEKLSGHQRRT